MRAESSLKSAPNNYEVAFVKDFGEVGCGRAVIPFPSKEPQVPVVLPPNAHPAQYGVMTVRGPSLTEDGIYDGDKLVVCFQFRKQDITAESICVVLIHPTGELVAKKLVRYGDKVCVRSSGGGIPDELYSWDEIEIRGVVISFQRVLDDYGRLTRNEPF